jgi:hypothetical protein
MPGPPGRSFHIDFEKAGNHTAFTYEHLIWMSFNLSVGIILHFASHKVTLKGKNLLELYEGLLLHEVSHVCEQPAKRALAEEDDLPVVNKIDIIQATGKGERFGMGTAVAVDPGLDARTSTDESRDGGVTL